MVEFTVRGVIHVIARHPEISDMLKEVEETLKEPAMIITSKRDKTVWIYYRFYERYDGYLCVVVKIYNGNGLILTSYVTDRLKKGDFI